MSPKGGGDLATREFAAIAAMSDSYLWPALHPHCGCRAITLLDRPLGRVTEINPIRVSVGVGVGIAEVWEKLQECLSSIAETSVRR